MAKKQILALRAAVLAAALGFATPAFSADALHGFLQGNFTGNLAGSNPDGATAKQSEERLQLRYDGSNGAARLFIKADAVYDNIEDRPGAELREGYFDYASDTWDLRAGQQVITWGHGDMFFINDVYPKDYSAFFSGRPMEYLKKGVPAVKAGLYPGFASFEAAVMPFFEPNTLPRPDRFYMYDPMASVSNRVEKRPGATIGNTEFALRAYRDIAGFDTSLYFYKGRYRNPSARPDNLQAISRITLYYPELRAYGLSLQRSALSGVVSAEAGYYESRNDMAGSDPLVPNSASKLLLGYQRQLAEDLSVSAQYYGEHMLGYSNYEKTRMPGAPAEYRYRQSANLRLTYLLMHQNLKLNLFSIWGISERDYMGNFEARYSFTDHVWGAIGANVFGGSVKTTQFGSMDKNDNAYAQIRYEF